jgi:hypothetical protein
MARIPSLPRSLSSTIPLARSIADRAVVTARPIVFGVLGRVATHLPGRPRNAAPPAPETFVPSRSHEPVAEEPTETSSAPTPASIARNVGAPRPSAKQPAARKPRSAPGAKLPISRPSPST